MAWELIDNIRGPKGDKGDRGTINSVSVATLPPESAATAVISGTTDVHLSLGLPRGKTGPVGPAGTLSSASAESVPAGDNAEVVMSGTSEVKHAHFKVPRGLPGVNAVENDAAVAAYVGAVDSETRLALNEAYPVRLVWDGAAYPARVPNAVNIFFGPVDPGLLMQPEDYWANPDVTTLPEVLAAILDGSGQVNAAVRAVTAPATVDVPVSPRDGDGIGFKNSGGPGALYGWELPPGQSKGVSGVVSVPSGWAAARVRAYLYVPTTAGAGTVRVTRAGATFSSGVAPVAVSDVTNSVVDPSAGVVTSILLTGDIPLTGATRASVVVMRAGSSGSDTLASPVYLVGVRLERVS